MSEGIIYLVGAGPGDPGLLTIRGLEVLGRADVVIYDYLVNPRLLDYAPPQAERIYVGKKAAAHTLSQEQINQLLVDKARTPATVVRLKGGDPYVFGRGGEEALALVEAGLAFEVVPGVTAGVAAPAYAGIPVTHRDFTSSFTLVAGHESSDKTESSLDFKSLVEQKATLAFYMGVKNLPHICRNLIAQGMEKDTPAAVIRWGTRTSQEVLAGTVETLPKQVQDAAFKPPALLIIGKVVSLRDKLKWFELRPLFGRRIVVTRARSQASKLTSCLQDLGAEVIELPTISIEPPKDPAPLHQAAARPDFFDWIIFTSVNAVDAFFAALSEVNLDSRALADTKTCVTGPATADRLKQFRINSDAQPARLTGSDIAQTLASTENLKGAKILLPRADIAPADLPESLARQGAIITEVTAYRTVPQQANTRQVADMLAGDRIHWITFTSSSTVKNFFDLVQPALLSGRAARLASIGPSTSATIDSLGLTPAVQAEKHTIDGLIESILAQEKQQT